MVLKLAEQTPLTGLYLGQLIKEAAAPPRELEVYLSALYLVGVAQTNLDSEETFYIVKSHNQKEGGRASAGRKPTSQLPNCGKWGGGLGCKKEDGGDRASQWAIQHQIQIKWFLVPPDAVFPRERGARVPPRGGQHPQRLGRQGDRRLHRRRYAAPDAPFCGIALDFCIIITRRIFSLHFLFHSRFSPVFSHRPSVQQLATDILSEPAHNPSEPRGRAKLCRLKLSWTLLLNIL